MGVLKGACIIGQSGGPTSAINASAYGAIRAALDCAAITKVYGALHGIRGVLDERLIDMGREDPAELALMRHTPSSALGSCRYKLKKLEEDDSDYRRILEVFHRYNVRYFFYNGGNDSMDTCNKISKFLLGHGYECRVMGIPKTIDNDLALTDHCPGYGSAAKYIATSVMEIDRDARVYDTGMVTVIEAMGRNAGWLTASAALASRNGGGADFIYLPEVPFEMDRFLSEVKGRYDEAGKCIAVVSEGIRDGQGRYVAEYAGGKGKDGFGHANLGGLAASLADAVKRETGTKVRGIEFSLLQRCAAHVASKADIDESFMAGERAVECAVEGATDKMVGFKRAGGGEYRCECELFDLKDVANAEKKVPLEWINAAGNGVLKPFLDYAEPLIQGRTELEYEGGLPRFVNLRKVLAKPE